MDAAPATAPVSDLFTSAMHALTMLRNQVPGQTRIDTDQHGVLMAMAVALRADCTRRRVGAVVVDVHGRVIGTGRNGAPPGRPGCLSAGACPRGQTTYQQVAPGSSYAAGAGRCIALHAELNALLHSDPLARRDGTIFITDAPCNDCSTALAGSGLARAVWPVPGEHGQGWTVTGIDIGQAPIGGHYG